MITTDYTKCLSCRWRDVNNVQCFDGHLQRRNLKSCEGYEFAEIFMTIDEEKVLDEVESMLEPISKT